MDGVSVVNALFKFGEDYKRKGPIIGIISFILLFIGSLIDVDIGFSTTFFAYIGIGYWVLSYSIPTFIFWMAHILLNLHQINENTKNSVNDKD